MRKLKAPFFILWLAIFGLATGSARSELWINEILFNPPGSSDSPNEYIELRGTPNLVLPAGTFLVCVEGDTNANPGTIQNIFDLSGKSVGGNGFLVLLQKTNGYAFHPNATVLINTDSGSGWGSGSTSSLNHRGESGQTELENGSCTFFLIQTTNSPAIGVDIDADNNGVPEGSAFASWTILDSIGVLDNDGLGDIAYGAVNFRRNAAAMASGIVIPVSFTPSYIGRAGNTNGSTATAWVAADSLAGVAPNWALGSSGNTYPSSFAGALLNHIGGPNFGAPAIPGVIVLQSNGSTDVVEGAGTDSYTVSLNTVPSGSVTVQITTTSQLQISTNNGVTFSSSSTLTFTTTAPRTILVRALDDNVLDTSPHFGFIRHAITATGDTVRYPTNSLVPTITASIIENDKLLLSELKVNPPGTNDAPNEFIEVRGAPGLLLTNVYLLVIEGNFANNPGIANVVVNLTSARLGSSGLLLLVASGHPYSIPDGTTVINVPQLNTPGGALENGTISFLLVSSPAPLIEGTDLDAGDNGILEGLPDGTTILDAVGWSDGGAGDVVYGGVLLTQSAGTPDAATRFSYNSTPLSAAAWFNGDLAGATGESLVYDNGNVSSNFPFGAGLTPGVFNNFPPSISGLEPISGVIGDLTNLSIEFTVNDAETDPQILIVTATSSNPLVVPDANLTITTGTGGRRTLSINPIGVGYATITLTVSDDDLTVQSSLPYAASAPGRLGGRFHIGVSDGSTAIPIDSNLMFVGDDENQTIRIYNRQLSGKSLASFNFTPFLGLTDIESGVPREVDIEASTRVGNRIFWIGSHSHANNTEGRTNRSRLFATDISGTGLASTLTYSGRYDFLKLDLVNWDMTNGHGKGANYYGLNVSTMEGVDPKAPDGSGFNLEGLAMAPGNTNAAYVALRAPIVPATNRNFALLVPVLNFASLAVNTGPAGSAVFGAPIELDLYGRGIRSIEGSTNGYVIVGGPSGDDTGNYPTDFRLYTWTGNPTDNAQQRAADLSGLNPEGIVELPTGPWTTNTQIQLISDNGRKVWYGDGIAAKHLTEPNFKKFRSDLVTLGAVVKPVPIITSSKIVAGGMAVSWRALKGETYQLEYKTVFTNVSWVTLNGTVTATGPVATKVQTPIPQAQCFYRVTVLP